LCKAGIDFSKLGKGQNATCPDCGQEHRTFNQEDDTCIQCQFHRTHPELATKYWTWARLDRNSWAAVCTWPENEEPPEPGQAIEIHRQDGRSSIKTITEVRPARFDPSGNMKVTCLVR
jgi:ribosomal protein L37E